MKLHKDITVDVIVAACERRMSSLDDPGFCNACGLECLGVEPDARNYPCESCGETEVFGCEELLIFVVG